MPPVSAAQQRGDRSRSGEAAALTATAEGRTSGNPRRFPIVAGPGRDGQSRPGAPESKRRAGPTRAARARAPAGRAAGNGPARGVWTRRRRPGISALRFSKGPVCHAEPCLWPGGDHRPVASRSARPALLRSTGGPRASQPRRGPARCRPAGRRRLPGNRGRGGRDRGGLPRRARADRPVRRRHLAGRPRGRAGGRRLGRFLADEPDPGGQPGGARLPGAGRRHPPAAQCRAAQRRAVLSGRSRRRRDPGRHGGDPRLRHRRGALRHDAGERARPQRGHARRADPAHRRAGAQIRRRARPHPALRGQRGHARPDHRNPAPPVWPAGDRRRARSASSTPCAARSRR